MMYLFIYLSYLLYIYVCILLATNLYNVHSLQNRQLKYEMSHTSDTCCGEILNFEFRNYSSSTNITPNMSDLFKVSKIHTYAIIVIMINI